MNGVTMENTRILARHHVAALAALCVLGCVVRPAPGIAQTAGVCGGLFGMMMNKTAQQTMNEWNALGGDVEQCVQQRVGMPISQLAQQCVEPSDRRIAGQVQSCRQAVAQARAQQRAAEAAHEAQLKAQREAQEKAAAAQEEAASRARAAQQAVLERQRKAAEAAAAQAKARAEAYRQELVDRYGQDHADAILAQKVLKGMSMDEVTDARGRPDSKVIVPPEDDEMWRYGADRIVFLKGKVTYVGQ